MGLGVLDTTRAHVPGRSHPAHNYACLCKYTEHSFCIGTTDILEREHPNNEPVIDSNLKYDRSGSVPILLVPQPSDDPNDPLVC